MNEQVIDAIRAHAALEAPRECCGVVIMLNDEPAYIPCRNQSSLLDQFNLHPEDYADAADRGEIVAIAHSHVFQSPEPTQPDLIGCESSGLPWIIVNYPVGTVVQIEPSGYVAPLIGRTFHAGILDCYTLIRDYYKQELQIDLPEYERPHGWEDRGENLYGDNFAGAGFVEVDTIEKHDVLLMKISASVIDHGAVYIGDNTILQHCTGHLSARSIYGGHWQKHTVKILRHKDLLCAT